MARRRSTSGAVFVALYWLYWLSGIAFFVEPFRWRARHRRRSQERQAAEADLARREALQRARLVQAEAQAAMAVQGAWAAYEDRQRQAAAARPAICEHCHRVNPAGSVECEHCGAPVPA